MKLNFCVQEWSFQLKLFPLLIWAQFSLALFGSFGAQLVKVKGDKSETHSHFPFTWRAPIHRWAPEFLSKIQNQIHIIWSTSIQCLWKIYRCVLKRVFSKSVNGLCYNIVQNHKVLNIKPIPKFKNPNKSWLSVLLIYHSKANISDRILPPMSTFCNKIVIRQAYLNPNNVHKRLIVCKLVLAINIAYMLRIWR